MKKGHALILVLVCLTMLAAAYVEYMGTTQHILEISVANSNRADVKNFSIFYEVRSGIYHEVLFTASVKNIVREELLKNRSLETVEISPTQPFSLAIKKKDVISWKDATEMIVQKISRTLGYRKSRLTIVTGSFG